MTRYQISGSAIALLGALVWCITPFQVDTPTSGIFPRFMAGCLVALGLLGLATSRRDTADNGVSLLNPVLILFLCLVFCTILSIRQIGFYPSACLFLPLCLILFGERNYKNILLFSLIIPGSIYLLINIILGSQLS